MKEAQLFYYCAKILTLTLLAISVLIGFLKFHLLKKEQKWYLFFLVFVFLIELICNLLIELGKENVIVYPFYISGEFFILTGLFISGLRLPRKFFIFSGIISLAFLTEAFILWSTSGSITSIMGKVISHIIIICLSGYYLILNLKKTVVDNTNSFIPVYSSLFLYYTVSLFLFLIMNQLSTTSILNASVLWGINNLLSSILYLISLITFFRIK